MSLLPEPVNFKSPASKRKGRSFNSSSIIRILSSATRIPSLRPQVQLSFNASGKEVRPQTLNPATLKPYTINPKTLNPKSPFTFRKFLHDFSRFSAATLEAYAGKCKTLKTVVQVLHLVLFHTGKDFQRNSSVRIGVQASSTQKDKLLAV